MLRTDKIRQFSSLVKGIPSYYHHFSNTHKFQTVTKENQQQITENRRNKEKELQSPSLLGRVVEALTQASRGATDMETERDRVSPERLKENEEW